ncbi:TetR/AcrR family transcriptional regulator (plasmid) [Mycobacterium sp. TJFP1]
MVTSAFFAAPRKKEPTRADRIRDAAMKCFAEQGIVSTTVREVAEKAGVSVGLVQHHFGNKAGLVEAVDEYVLQVFGTVAESVPVLDPLPAKDSMDGVGGRFTKLLIDHPDAVDYVARALVEGGAIGATIFDGLLEISCAQRDLYTAHGLGRPGLDPLWGAMNAMILRVGAMILRPHIDRHLPEPFFSQDQLERWDTAVALLIRKGQFRDGYDSNNS